MRVCPNFTCSIEVQKSRLNVKHFYCQLEPGEYNTHISLHRERKGERYSHVVNVTWDFERRVLKVQISSYLWVLHRGRHTI